ncbi:MAG: CAP domain-containing protein, partial [Boseongicola sp.]|nr:CAP domain-containing protein [Boseongicola sp.]
MRATFAAVAAGIAFTFASVQVADACNRDVSAKAAQTVVPAKGINQALLEEAIRVEVNFHRCRAGLSKVSLAGQKLTKQATVHSSWMAKSQKLSHKSSVSGSKTLKQRVKKAGVAFRTGSENIARRQRNPNGNTTYKIDY